MSAPSKVWVDSIKAHLEVLSTTCGHVQARERLEVADLNDILAKFEECKMKFLLICELHGFKTVRQQQPNDPTGEQNA